MNFNFRIDIVQFSFVYDVSCIPFQVCVFLRLCGRWPTFSVQYFCWRLAHASALINPFQYGFLRKSLRTRLRRFLHQRLHCLRGNRVSQQTGKFTFCKFTSTKRYCSYRTCCINSIYAYRGMRILTGLPLLI